ncbi:kynureninase-like [Aricia agestis]|uniref:kynureninase-like n=1 Tax=Aricia agestis TaxID=91739 RepID=UPI001C206ED1|nr:kynureninase-like [Aricia agestis]
MYEFKDGLDHAQYLDSKDPLGAFRKRFYLREDTVYLCGNSLGLASKDAENSLFNVLDEWKYEGVQLWSQNNNKFLKYSAYLAKLMAPLVGADAKEIALSGSTTVSIHQCISTFYKPREDRYKILVDDVNFSSDRYAVDSQVRLKGYDPAEAVKVVKCRGRFMSEDDVISAMTPEVALVLLPVVYYRSAQILDVKRVTDAAKSRGIFIGWDMCHAAGVIDFDLRYLDVDFAVWCTYKYLNGGPGAPSALYINKKHFHLTPGMCGWFGNRVETQFKLNQEFDHKKDANGWQIGTPHLLSMGPLEGSLKMFLEAGMTNVRLKSLKITAYLMYLSDLRLSYYGFDIGNPREDDRRGGHVCLRHREAYRISIALKNMGVVQDFRPPNVIRITPAALYTSYEEVYRVVEMILLIVKNETYKSISTRRSVVV